MIKRLLLPALVLLLFLMALLPAGAASSGDAGEQLWNDLRGHGYGVLKMDDVYNNAQYVDAEINGHRVYLLIDTGAVRTVLTTDCARHLKLNVHDTGTASMGTGGIVKGTTGLAVISSFKLGGYEINRTNTVCVLPKGATVGEIDGLLGYDFLKANAMIIPVGANFVFYKPGNGAIADISSYMTNLGFKAAPVTHESIGLIVAGHLNNVPLTAVIDCGASYSLFNLDFLYGPAKALLRPVGYRLKGVDGTREPTYAFTPKELDFGGLNLHPEELFAQFSPSLEDSKHQAFLGFDLLAEHDAIIDLGHDILWVK